MRQQPAAQLPVAARAASAPSLEPFEEAAAPVVNRPIFPYSIVPGGVRDGRELQRAAASDRLVAQHYSDFRISRTHAFRLDHSLAMYVSYRRNNHVFWTRNRMVIPAGEILISDGENLARVRCANRLSPVAVKPVAETEPAKEELNEPSYIPPLLAELLPGEGTELFPGAPTAENAVPPLVPSGPSAFDTPPAPLLPPFLGPGVPPLVPLTPGPPPVITPEPGSLSLLLLGAAFISLLAALTLRRNGSA